MCRTKDDFFSDGGAVFVELSGASVEFDLQPTLKGNLIEIRPLTQEDFDALFVAASDPLIWEQHPENDRYTKEVFQTFFDGAIASKGAFAIIERKSGRISYFSSLAKFGYE